MTRAHVARLPDAVRAAAAAAAAAASNNGNGEADAERRLRAIGLAARADAGLAHQARFLSILSHEFRTPLSAITGWTALMRRGRLDEATTREAVEVIERACRFQRQLLEEVLDVAQVLGGKVRLDERPVAVAEWVHAAVAAARADAEAKGLTLEATVPAGLGCVRGDVARLRQALGQLLGNAVKFTPPGGHVQVRAGRDAASRTVSVAVSDTGDGLPPHRLAQVFEPFRGLDDDTRRAHGGLGFGLAIVRHLIEMHGGAVAATSPGEGMGSTFGLTLPSAAETSAPAVAPSPSRPAAIESRLPDLRGVRVLVVDDEADIRELVAQVLTEAGADVSASGSVAGASRVLEVVTPDVIVSDIGMPGEDGFDLIGHVRRRDAASGRATPAMALTAYADDELRRRVLESGFQRHMGKPFSPADVATAVAELAAGRARRR